MAFDNELFAKTIKETRKSKMTTEELAERLGKEPRTISRIESGENLTPIPVFLEMCEIFEMTPDQLLDGYLKVKKHKDAPTDFDQLISLLCTLETDQISFVLDFVKLLKKQK